MLGPSAIPLSIQMGRDERLVGPGGVPFPDARERLWTGWFLQIGGRHRASTTTMPWCCGSN